VGVRLETRDWLLISALMGSWAVVFALGVSDGLRTGLARFAVMIASASARDAFPVVVSDPWEDPALERGDLVRSLEGEDTAGWSGNEFFRRAARAVRGHGFARLEVERAGRRLEVRLEPARTPVWWIGFLFSAALIGTALLLLLRAPHWHLARRYFVACWLFAVVACTRTFVGPPASELEMALSWLLPVAGALTVWNAQDFTLSARPVPWHQRAWVGVVFLLLSALYLTLGCGPTPPRSSPRCASPPTAPSPSPRWAA
jgi:hypothetical protein